MILDTSAWIEFFQGTENCETVAQVLRKEQPATSTVTLAEIVHWCLRNKLEHKIADYLDGIRAGSRILHASEHIFITAGMLNYERKKINKRWGMVDSIILATAHTYGLGVLTKDSQFKDLPNIRLLKR